jgi:hypothetical protein
VGPRDFYDALAPLAATELQRLRNAGEDELSRLVIGSVEVAEDAENGIHIAVLFSDPARPECRFGWRWAWTERPKAAELEFAAATLAVNLEEDIVSDSYGLPEDCAGDGVTWF